MRRSLAIMMALVAASLTGCFTTTPDRAITHFEAQAPFTIQPGEDGIQLDVYLVERPAADGCINRDIWELADEQVLQDRKRLLDDNGFRACVLGETPPDGLQSLLRSERSCANPRRLRLHTGKPAQIVLGPIAPQLRFQLRQEGKLGDVDLEQAQCLLLVTPRVAENGRLVLQFTPAVRHGEAVAMPRPVQDPSGVMHWDVQTDQPTETYRSLGWELTVAPNTYIAVGTLLDHEETLGQGAFLARDGSKTQRLLVLRAGRIQANGAAPDETNGKSPSLAQQAGAISARAVGP